MSNHTPGPWSAAPEGNECEWGVDAGIWGVAICAAFPGGGSTEANARLISAAPELLESLRRMVANNVPLTGNPSHEQLVNFWESEKSQGRGEAEDMLFALAAIAKATGSQS